jgi:ATP-dependent DNA helicase DinG
LSKTVLPLETSHALDALCLRLDLAATGAGHRAAADAATAGLLLRRLAVEAAARSPAVLRAATGWLEPAREQQPGLYAFFQQASVDAGAARPGAPAPASSRPDDRSSARRVVPRGQVEPLVAGAFAAEGLFAGVLEGFEVRPEQAEMAGAVLECLTGGGALAVEAGTGVGKSLAYLLPAIAVAERSGEKVVISTHTITLQDQLAENDVPLVELALGREVRHAVLKGRTNYLCLRKWDEFLSGSLAADETERLFGLRLLMWLDQTATGDCSELNLSGAEQDCWELVGGDEACWGKHCPRARVCFANRARELAEKADIVIVNHSLVCSDLAAENGVLPPYQHLVIDEAHHFEGVATEHLGLSADRGHLAGLLGALAFGRRRGRAGPGPRRPGASRLLAKAAPEATEAVSKAAGRALGAVDRLFGFISPAVDAGAGETEDGFDPVQIRGRFPAELRYGRGMSGLPEGALELALETAAEVGLAARQGRHVAESLPEDDPEAIELGWHVRSAALASLAVEQLAKAERGDWVYWARRDDASTRLQGVPVDVGEELRVRLWPNLRSVTMVSATLAVAGSFEHFLGCMGLGGGAGQPQVTTRLLRSPFDFRRQVLLCVPDDLPLPVAGGLHDRQYSAAVAHFLGQLLPATGGRALVLFTSHRLLREVYAMSSGELAARGLRVYGQGIDGGRSRLLRAMRSEDRAVVFGSATFWEGVDVRGPQLSCIVITRLPFPRPDEPLVAARQELLAGRGEDPFASYTLPQAVLRFKQGFGRLVRSATDRGVVAVLDGRLLRRRYGRVFTGSLPEPSHFVGPTQQVVEKARSFLAETGGEDAGRNGGRPAFSWRTGPPQRP